jgi:hypothetical protein
LKYRPNAESLFKISGPTSRDVRLSNTDISNARKDFQLAADVPVGAVLK